MTKPAWTNKGDLEKSKTFWGRGTLGAGIIKALRLAERYCVSPKVTTGSGTGIRTPVNSTRNCCPTARRSPKKLKELQKNGLKPCSCQESLSVNA